MYYAAFYLLSDITYTLSADVIIDEVSLLAYWHYYSLMRYGTYLYSHLISMCMLFFIVALYHLLKKLF